jgi:hypothetical protein
MAFVKVCIVMHFERSLLKLSFRNTRGLKYPTEKRKLIDTKRIIKMQEIIKAIRCKPWKQTISS